ncbi:DUF262 domain-containing protein [Psychrobacter sp. CAM01]|uniref:DUF262 domain-containing protein n=1 Tax=Psychrobacter sp. CAM01 TaxID=3080335 RepID=UPI002935DCAA|nr:DUF262 domain-containing protein [Psychrobacter sp. CAM01]MDV2859142.1 DUF262 domain-containing protein [Psychrobacter sp. CAM01]
MGYQNQLFSRLDFAETEREIRDNQKQFDFDIREYPIEVIAMKFNPSQKDPEIFIPDYQREFVWSDKQKSLFIESLLIGLPIPYLFVADIDEDEDPYTEGNVEVIDGAQRIQTIYAYLNDHLSLTGMERLKILEGSLFSDLPPVRQRRFNRSTIRMIELKDVDEDARRLMFDRLNSGGTKLTDMEKWIGTKNSRFIDFIRRLASDDLFMTMTPMPASKEKRRERTEYVLRFFAYRDRYLEFGRRNDGTTDNSVLGFLDDYINDMDESFTEATENSLETQFIEMLHFVRDYFPNGFRKSATSKAVSRIRFEAMSVGASLALSEDSSISPTDNYWAYEDPDFLAMIRSDASNSRPKIKKRIEFVKNKLLGDEVNLEDEVE